MYGLSEQRFPCCKTIAFFNQENVCGKFHPERHPFNCFLEAFSNSRSGLVYAHVFGNYNSVVETMLVLLRCFLLMTILSEPESCSFETITL